MNRRSILGLLATASIVGPAVVKDALASPAKPEWAEYVGETAYLKMDLLPASAISDLSPSNSFSRFGGILRSPDGKTMIDLENGIFQMIGSNDPILSPAAQDDEINEQSVAAPSWDEAERVHDWRYHVSENVQAMWPTFTIEQKLALAEQANDIASNEDWD